MAGPLQGLKILDLTWNLAGPFGIMILGDLGAEIVKVERLPAGDQCRRLMPKFNGISGYFFSLNRGKKSFAIDLKAEKGKEIFLSLVKLVDVVAESFTPGTMTKLGLDYEVLKKHNPRLIYAACSGFGQTGPYASKPALDIVAQAISGLISLTGPEDGPPVRTGVSIADVVSGLFLAFGILAALEERRRSNQGQMVDIAMLDSLVSIMENPFMRYFATGEAPERVGHRHPLAAIHQILPTRDGYMAVVASGGVEQWATFLEVIGRLDLLSDERYHDSGTRREYANEFEPIISEALRAKTTAEWQQEFEAVGIPCGPVNDISQAARDPQLLHREMFIDIPCPQAKSGSFRICNSPMRFSRTPHQAVRKVPELGEHTEEVLSTMLNMSKDEIAALNEQGIIMCRQHTP